MESISSTKKMKKAGKAKKNELLLVRVWTAKAGSKKYTHVDWDELSANNGRIEDEEDLKRFYDEDTLMMAKKLRETRGKNGKRIHVNLDELQHYNRNAGYDEDDDFIDDSEVVEDGRFSYKKGRFYMGKGEVKEMDEIEEEESSEDEEVVVREPVKSKKKKKEKKAEKTNGVKESSTSSSSDSEAEPQRMTGAPPTRMAGTPPSKRLLKRPTPPPPSSTQQKRDPSPPKEIQKKKTSIPEDSSSQGTDIICIDDEEPPAKKQKEDGPPVLTPEGSLKEKSTSEASTSSEVVKKSPPTSTAILAKKIIKQHEDASKANGTSTPPKEKGMGAILATLFESLKKKGAEFQEKKMTEFDDDTLMEISRFLDVIKAQKQEKINMEPLIYTIASSFGMKSKDVIDQVERGVLTRKDPLDWKLTQADLPFMSEQEIANMTTMVKSWKSKKELTNAVLTAWLKDVNQGRMTLDQARKKFFEVINLMPDLEKQQDTVIELPKHERSRKARMFLHQWIFLSREYIADLIPQLRKKTPSTVSLAQKQVAAVNVMREQVKKQIGLHEQKKERNGEDIPFVFMFTDPVQAAIGPYLEELLEYSLSIKSLVTIISGIDSLHQAVKDHITLIQFYVEIVRRHQKLSFMAVEEPMKTMFNEAKENIYKIQVVQNPKYQIVWPDGEEPSMRHMTKEIHEFQVSILKKPPKKSTSTPLRPSTSSPATAPKPPVITLEDPKHQQAVNQLVQMYLGKYLLSSTGGTTIICDATKFPISEELLPLLVNLIATSGITLANQMAMYKNILTNVGQVRMTRAVQMEKTKSKEKMATSDYQKVFEFFAKLENASNETAAKEKSMQKQRQLEEERAKREKEKKEERERRDAEKREEKERKEREKREERERREKEIKEMQERKRREEEDREEARKRLFDQMEAERRRKEAEEAVEKELERRAKLEKEEANALQGLEEDLLMDDDDFMNERKTKEDEERKIQEANRAVERAKQIKEMRKQELERRKEEEEVPPTVPPPEETRQQVAPPPPPVVQVAPPPPPPKPPVEVKKEIVDTSMDILNAAQVAAGLEEFNPHRPLKQETIEKPPMSAMEKLASLRGRTMSADMKRGGGGGDGNSPGGARNGYPGPSNPRFFPSNNSMNQMNSQPPLHQEPQFHPSSSSSSLSYNNAIRHQNQNSNIIQNRGIQSNGGFYSNQEGPHHPHQSSPQTMQQQQQFQSYQSQNNHNSSLMHTPHSNSSMIAQSPQFPSHSSPMSQQFHTPPSVGMMNHMVPSTMAPPPQQPLQHFNFPPQQMNRQQQMMAQQQQQQLMHQQQMMHNQMNLHNYPPNH